MKKALLILLICCCNLGAAMVGQKYTLSGYIKDASNGEDLIGATIYVEEIGNGTATNTYGFYSLSLKKGTYHIKVAYMGYQTTDFELVLDKSITQNFELKSDDRVIKEVDVTAERKDQNVKSVEMSINKLPMRTILKIPALLGEVDVIRAIQMLPGVQTAGEGSVGFYVRGGGADQNLVLLDEATVYNASHLGGLFSVFNQDVVKDVKLYKGGIPAQFGGRLASILEINMKEGNKKQFGLSGGLGVISSRLTVEGPIIKDKISFCVSGRRSYLDLFFPLMPDTNIHDAKFFFHDFTAKANYQINDKNKIFISGYFGRDVSSLGDLFSMDYGNKTLTARYNHLFNHKLFSNLTFVYSLFDYGLGSSLGDQGFKWVAGIDDNISIKNDYTWYLNPNNTIKFGGHFIHHTFRPGEINPTGENSIFNSLKLDNNFALDYGGFIENEQKVGSRLTLRYGLRYSVFQNKGPYTNYIYTPNEDNEGQYEVTDTVSYSDGELFNKYDEWEPRASVKLDLDNESSLKLSYNRMAQYIHQTTNTMTITPIDIWFPSTPNVKPEKADQIALGYFRNFRDNLIEASLEVYYKKMYNSIDYRDHAWVLLNEFLEGELRFGDSYSYGVEFLAKKQTGRFNGWLSYTYSRVFRDIPEINEGRAYPANYDKPHDVSLVLSYDITEKLNVGVSWFYSTGAARTYPVGRYEFGNMIVPEYKDRNTVRLPDYHRMDLGLTYKFSSLKPNGEPKRFSSNLNLSVYNVYNRHNAFSIVFNQSVTDPYITEAKKYYLFPVLPTLTYNFKF